MHFSEKITVGCSPEQVWAFFMDVNNLPRWDRGVARVERISSGPPGVGSTFDTVGFGERGRMSYRVTELTPLRSYTAETRSGYFKQAEWHFEMEPAPAGTLIHCVACFTLRARFIWLAPLLYLTARRGAIRDDLAQLKRVLEAGDR